MPNGQQRKLSLTEEVIKENGWGELIDTGQFDQVKALQSIEATTKEFISTSNYVTVSDVLDNPSASLATIKKYRGEGKMKAVVRVLLQRVLDFLNVGRGMDQKQIESTVNFIWEEYYYLTVGDVKVCLKNGAKGKYGKLFDRIDGMIILDWFGMYDDERMVETERRSHLSHLEKKVEYKSEPTFMPDWLSEKINDLSKNAQIEYGLTKRPKYKSLSDYLESIGKNDEPTKSALMKIWMGEYLDGELPFDGFCIYKSSELVNTINDRKDLPEEIREILEQNHSPENNYSGR